MSATAPPRRPRRETPGPSALPDPDSALIEEARRRARRRRLGYVAIVALAALGVGLFLALHNGGDGPARHGRTPAGAGPKPAPQAGRQQDETVFAATPKIVGEAGLAAPGVGWAINGLGLYWTRDDGLHWRLITPPDVMEIGDAVARIGEIVYLAPGHIWLVASDVRGASSVGGSTRHVALELTSDGGRTWQSVILPGCYACGETHLSALGPRRGYALAAAEHVSRLYATVDGGTTWKQVAFVPVDGPLAFSSGRRGWALGADGQALYGTHDGGRDWQRIELPTPQRYVGERATFGAPRTFSGGLVVVPVRFRDGHTRAQHVVVYVTRDGGATWAARLAPGAANVIGETWAFPKALSFSAPTATDWLLFAGPRLFVTHDAGRTWSVVQPQPAPRRTLDVYDLDFVSPSIGWAIFRTTLVETRDGGRKWRPLASARR